MPFKNRWRITGTLTTTTPLHVGNGETRTLCIADSTEAGGLRAVEVAAVATDAQERPYLPGTTLKGTLRAWARAHLQGEVRTLEVVFGSEQPGTPQAVGGKAEFWDAYAIGFPEGPPQVPYWNPDRCTGVEAAVAIERRTRTASTNKLFYMEFVPPGVQFQVTVTGQDLEPEELDLLLAALEGANDVMHPLTLGASTGNTWGRCTWQLDDLARCGKEEVLAWLQQPSPAVGYAALVSLDEAERVALRSRALTRQFSVPPATLSLALTIHCDGPFLVNDPSHTHTAGLESSEPLPNHAPRRDHRGRVVLPARSFRGALRSQAEKILRTLHPAAACRIVDPVDACQPISTVEQHTTRLCLACQVFGAPGWRAPVTVSDFCLAEGCAETPFWQEFLAIDRFTGGGAEGRKFNAMAVYRPMLTGTLTVDLHRVEPWALGLLALTLRDLIEGDVPLGFGAAKGYGACHVEITGVRVSGIDTRPDFWALLQGSEATQIDWQSLNTATTLPTEVELVVLALVEAFQHRVQTFRPYMAQPGGKHALS